MLLSLGLGLMASEVSDSALKDAFRDQVEPFLQDYCVSCHGEKKPKAKFSVSGFQSLEDVVASSGAWEVIAEKLREKEMPPEEADSIPSTEVVDAVLAWYERLCEFEAERNDGDPGTVLARRLSNAEYNYAIEDLTGHDLRPTREFPVDAANQAGFDNTGESLSISPGLLQKYLQAARSVVEHLVFTPEGLTWSSHPVVTETDRDKYAVLRIVDFYLRQPTDLAEYFFVVWKRVKAGGEPSLAELAADHGVSPHYLNLIWDLIHQSGPSVGPVHGVRQAFGRLLELEDEARVRERCEALRDTVLQIRRQIEPEVKNLEGGSVHRGSQSYVLWKNQQYAANRRRYDAEALMTPSEIEERIAASERAIEKARQEERRERDWPEPFEAPHEALWLPESPDQHAIYHQEFARFADVIPDRFYVSERGRDYLGKRREDQEKGRFLSAGFHSMMGYFRDDQPLYDLILDEASRAELDRLWDELDFITQAPKRQFIGFLWFERTDSRFMTDPVFDFARAEHEDATNEAKIHRLAKVYLNHAQDRGAGVEALGAIEAYFDSMNDRIRWLERVERSAEENHLAEVVALAERAYGRSVEPGERKDLARYYRALRESMGLSHEGAIRDCVVSVLVSPHFFLRMVEAEESAGAARVAIKPSSLAQRLSAFLWSSVPDEELRVLASLGVLADPAVLTQQAQRMLRDPKSVRLAREFGGNWLDFRRFESHNAVDRERFPTFDDALRTAMFLEPIHYLADVIRGKETVASLIFGSHTYADGTLAKHYGFPVSDRADASGTSWQRFDRASEYGRGGLLPMAVFLTQNAPGLRTSPVKRGYWVARRILGESIPPPPPDVPELPEDEADLGELTLSQALAKHRDHASCASCHERFDSLGLVFEGFGPVGERRAVDLGGRPVSTLATFPDESTGAGLDGLLTYIRSEREADFYRHFSRLLLSYGLGRTLILSDEPLVERMLAKLRESDYSFSVLIEAIVTSPQFRMKRGIPAAETNHEHTL